MTWNFDIPTTAVISVIQGAIAYSIKRWIDTRDSDFAMLSADVRRLKEERLKELQNEIRSHGDALVALQTDYVRKVDCSAAHSHTDQIMVRAVEKMEYVTTQLASVCEKVKGTASFIHDVNERLIGVSADVNRMMGRMEQKEARTTPR